MSFSDPIQEHAVLAIEKCRRAGVKVIEIFCKRNSNVLLSLIKVILISGDHPVTACALAKRLTVFSPESETVEDVAIKLGVPVDRVEPRQKKFLHFLTHFSLFFF